MTKAVAAHSLKHNDDVYFANDKEIRIQYFSVINLSRNKLRNQDVKVQRPFYTPFPHTILQPNCFLSTFLYHLTLSSPQVLRTYVELNNYRVVLAIFLAGSQNFDLLLNS